MPTNAAIEMKRKYIEGCESDHLRSYTTQPLQKYIHEARYRTIMELLPSSGFLLDAGCGYGVFELRFLSKKKGLQIVGADVSGKAIRSAKRRNPIFHFVQCDVENLPFKQNVFDCVVATEVVEHVPNPLRALRELERVSKNLVIATVPNVLNFSFLRAVGTDYIPEFRFLSNFFSKLAFVDFQLSNLRWVVIGFIYVYGRDFFDFKHYHGNVHRLYKPDFFLELIKEANLELVTVRGTTLIPQFAPKQVMTLIHVLSSMDKIIAKRRWKLSLVITALCKSQQSSECG